MGRWWFSGVFVLAAAVSARAQDNLEEKREDLLKEMRARLEESRKEMKQGIEKILSEELTREDSAFRARVKEQMQKLKQRLDRLEKEERRIRFSLLQLKWVERDMELVEGVRRSGMEPPDAQALFQDAMTAHQDEDFDVSIPGFKKIYYAYAGHQDARFRQFASTSAYNVACGYSLDGKKKAALDWLELSYALGILQRPNFLDHIKQDTDLDNIREEGRFKKLIRRYGPKQ